MKYILVCGGVISGVGKGVAVSSLGRVLKEEGHRVTVIKIDPYLNCDAGTLGPRDHGEIFVLSDGTETDLDLGNYERFLNVTLSAKNSITSGRIYSEVIQIERRGGYLGKTVQVVPHVTDHIKQRIMEAAQIPVDGSNNLPEICLIELGGVVGDIESLTFVEALRQMIMEVGKENFVVAGVDYVLELNQEHKTKPVQSSAKRARELGISYDLIFCRSAQKISQEALRKISLFTGVGKIIELPDYDVLKVPDNLRAEGFVEYIKARLSLPNRSIHPEKGIYFKKITAKKSGKCRVAIVGKYSNHEDAYLSIKESLKFAGASTEVDVDVETTYFDTSFFLQSNSLQQLLNYDGIVIPGGFGKRGVEEMIKVAEYVRENNKVLLGICLGMQIIVIEYTRNVLGIRSATSEELVVEEDIHTIIDDRINTEEISSNAETFLAISKHEENTMRIGERGTAVVKGSQLEKIYGKPRDGIIRERFRHRYGVTNTLAPKLEKNNLRVGIRSGKYVDGLELVGHPFYIGVQFHPEFLSRPGQPHPLFVSFLRACVSKHDK